MIFFSPIWLLLLLPLAAALYRWRLPTRGLHLVRFIIIVLLVLAMAQPAMGGSHATSSQIQQGEMQNLCPVTIMSP